MIADGPEHGAPGTPGTPGTPGRWRLVIDTATRRTIVAVGDARAVVAAGVIDGADRHGARLLSQLEGVLEAAGIGMADITAIGVGTGPGSFTGLRVGLAMAKTLAARRHLALVGIPTDEALRRGSSVAVGQAAADALIVMPAGAHDHYLGMPGADPRLVPPGTDIAAVAGERPVVAVDVAPDAAWLAPLAAAARRSGWPLPTVLGEVACNRMPAALLELLDVRLSAGDTSDPAMLVPRYVALPRGISAATVAAADGPDAAPGTEGRWSPASR